VDQAESWNPAAGLRTGMPAGLRLAAAIIGLFVLTLALSGLVARAASTVAAVGQAPAQRSSLVESAAYPAWTVGPGDSLWSIARATAPGADPRATVQVLRTLNGLSPQHVLQVGEVLQLPTR
jgi:LysM repeat protein